MKRLVKYLLLVYTKFIERSVSMAVKKTPPQAHCPHDCSFLEKDLFQGENTLPFYCHQFECFLGFDTDVIRCSECLGAKRRNIKEEGLHLISAYPKGTNRPLTKLGFCKMFPNARRKMVDILSKKGKPIALGKGEGKMTPEEIKKAPESLMDSFKEVLTEGAISPKETLASATGLKAETLPRNLDDKTAQLIVNLMAVLDNTEKKRMTNALQNSQKAEKLINKIKEIPKDNKLLATVRKELELTTEEEYENENANQLTPEQLRLQQLRQIRTTGRNRGRIG
jgi:hypothetical protein